LIHLYTGGVLDLATHAGGFLGMMNTAVAWGESKLRSDRVKAAVQRNAEAGRRTGSGSRPFGYKIISTRQPGCSYSSPTTWKAPTT
jgi:DNA invertase Pin-like site-specific DNA recombinase